MLSSYVHDPKTMANKSLNRSALISDKQGVNSILWQLHENDPLHFSLDAGNCRIILIL